MLSKEATDYMNIDGMDVEEMLSRLEIEGR